MLINGGESDGVRLLGRKTVELMTLDHTEGRMHLPLVPPRGFGLGLGIIISLTSTHMLGTEGAFGWHGAANTDFWIDLKENLVGLLLLQFIPARTYPVIPDFRTAAVYQAIV